MYRRCVLVVTALAAGLGLVLTSPATGDQAEPAAGEVKEVLADQVNRAIKRGRDFLLDKQKDDGSWETGPFCATMPGGWTSLSLLALLNSGMKPDDPHIVRGLQWLRTVEPDKTYVVGLQTMVFALAGNKQDAGRIQRNVD